MSILANKTSRNCTELCTGIKKSISTTTQHDRTVAGDGKNFSSKGEMSKVAKENQEMKIVFQNMSEESFSDDESKGKERSEKKRGSNSCSSKINVIIRRVPGTVLLDGYVRS
ncbi:hypothetical protein SADUNF_Sadunf08G0001600 [Salix dunnii]|uniref:Uncharacterized protein n=1 Tax=Salix dunnii TaxID=1413687 RepID=A0A835N0K7_9ROSI|nr:hypothetical protein SADUNF_Sadunf08G0001600 [Salix dunnii]